MLTDLERKYYASRVLQSLRSLMSPEEVSRLTGLSRQEVWRYSTLRYSPGLPKANRILGLVGGTMLIEKVVGERTTKNRWGFIETWRVAYNKDLVFLAALKAVLNGVRGDVVLTVAADGLPLATQLSILLKARLAAAKNYADAGVEEYLEEEYISAYPPERRRMLLPRDILHEGDEVVVADDLVRSGRTLEALVRLAGKAGARVSAGVFLVALREALPRIRRILGEAPFVVFNTM